MPKDNEVDEKVIEPVAVIYPDTGLRNDAAAMALWRNHGYDTGGEPLYSAATVAELRAEVERLDACIDAIHENWMNYGPHREIVARADAAERRVVELTSLLSDTVGNLHRMGNNEFADCDQERLDIVISRIERTLTGADPT